MKTLLLSPLVLNEQVPPVGKLAQCLLRGLGPGILHSTASRFMENSVAFLVVAVVLTLITSTYFWKQKTWF